MEFIRQSWEGQLNTYDAEAIAELEQPLQDECWEAEMEVELSLAIPLEFHPPQSKKLPLALEQLNSPR